MMPKSFPLPHAARAAGRRYALSASTAAPPSSSSAPTAPPDALPDPGVLASRWAALACAVLLAVLCAAWELWLAPTGRGSLAVKALPLLFALPGLWRMRLYTYRWLSLAVWLYLAEGLVRATSEAGPSATLAWLEALLAVALFVACAAHVRLRLAAGRRRAAREGAA